MTYRVIVQPRAERDIQAAAQWIEEQSKFATKALRWVRSIRASIETLKANPKRCPVDPDSDAFGEEVRLLLYGKRRGKHRILFVIRGDTVRVLTVRHSARQSLGEESGQGGHGGGRGTDSLSEGKRVEFTQEEWNALLARYPPGTPVSGVVTSCQVFGVFVCVDQLPKVPALLEIIHFKITEDAPQHRIVFPDDYPSVGSRVEAHILDWCLRPKDVRLTQLSHLDWSHSRWLASCDA